MTVAEVTSAAAVTNGQTGAIAILVITHNRVDLLRNALRTRSGAGW